jgi:hypothetical protein
MQLDKIIDRVGDWNPQLFRELKGRFSGNSSTFMIFGSIAIQFAFGLFVADGNVSAGFQILNWLLPIALMMGGIYTLVSDISQEEKAGTLNFIRLSPQSARDIFIGKMLGVPSLVYLAVLLTIPLHLVLAIASGASLGLMLAWYSTIVITTYFCLSVATLYAIAGGRFAIVLSVILVQPIGAIVSLYNYYLSSAIGKATWLTAGVNSMLWFYLPIANNIWLFYGFINLTFLVISYWLWVRIDRYYINPKSTNFTKQQSYWLNLNTQTWLFGFVLSILTFCSNDTLSTTVFHMLVIFSGIGSFLTFISIPLIVPSKQSMQDWSRYRRSHVTSAQKRWWERDVVQDLLWHDRSPSVLAMAINLMIPAIIYSVCAIVFIHDLGLVGKLAIGIVISTILTLICTVIANLLSLRSNNNKRGGVIPLLGLLLLLPLFGSAWATIMMNTLATQFGTNLLLFSPLFSAGIQHLSSLEICFDTIVQLAILAGCTKLLQGKLQKLGASESQKVIDMQPALGRSNIMR